MGFAKWLSLVGTFVVAIVSCGVIAYCVAALLKPDHKAETVPQLAAVLTIAVVMTLVMAFLCISIGQSL